MYQKIRKLKVLLMLVFPLLYVHLRNDVIITFFLIPINLL